MPFPILQPVPRPGPAGPISLIDYRSPSPISTFSACIPDSIPSSPGSPSSVAATVATSRRSGASSPFGASSPTPRATSPGYEPLSVTPPPLPRVHTPQPAQPSRTAYVPPHRRISHSGNRTPSRPRFPFVLGKGLGLELDHFALRDLALASNAQPPAVIRDVRISGGYKWIEPPPGVSGPTIAVPGAPDIWMGRARTDARLKRDADLEGNVEYPDYNGESMPKGYDTLDLVFNSLKSPAELDGVQILTGRNNLKKLFSVCCGSRRFHDFRLDARVIPGSRLVMLSRWELPAALRGREPQSWHLAFHEQNTLRLFEGSDRTPGYHRILRYNFGGLLMMVKCDVSAALPWDRCNPDDGDGTRPSVAGKTDEGDDTGEEEDKCRSRGDWKIDQDDLDDLMSLDSFSFYRDPGTNDAVFSGPPRRLSSGVNMVPTPFPHPPQGHLISLKTRQTYPGAPRGIRHLSQADAAFSMVFFGQIGNVYLAHHWDGEFETQMLEYRLGEGTLADMERGHAGTIRKVRDVLKWIYDSTLKHGSVGVVFSGGQVTCFAKGDADVDGALSEESWEVIKQSGIQSVV